MDTPSSPNELPLIGSQVGDYRVLRRLGRGGMAHVFLAEQLSLSRLVALKVLKPELASDPAYIQRFKNEAKAAAALVHANIVQIFEVGESDGIYYIAQEYVAGMNLSQYLRSRGPVSPLMAVNVMTQVSAALRKAKSLGVVHRDIKPENIMLSTDGEAKVADFGLARLTTQMQRSDLTQIGITMGTPLYMSPEQIEGHDVDHRADLYSFGVTAYHMMTGSPPFQGDNPISVAIQHAKDIASPIKEVRPDIPESLIAIVEKLMAKNAKDRYQSASEVLDALRGVHVESTAEDWHDLLRNLQRGVAGADLNQSQLAATRRLETLMSSRRRNTGVGKITLWLVGVVLLPMLLGAVWSQFQGYSSLEAVAAAEKNSIRQETIFDQYVFAAVDRSEESWQAVIGFHPSSESLPEMQQVIVQYAKERLAEFYLENERWSDALVIYGEFMNLQKGEQWRLVGEYGSAISRFHLGDSQLAKQLITAEPPKLSPVLQHKWQEVVSQLEQGGDGSS